jgi:hypothetical protein
MVIACVSTVRSSMPAVGQTARHPQVARLALLVTPQVVDGCVTVAALGDGQLVVNGMGDDSMVVVSEILAVRW